MSTFTNQFILNTYGGILHSDGELNISQKSIMYDGFGNESALTLGRKNNGASVSGNLSSTSLNVGQLTFPSLSSDVNNVLIQKADGIVDFSDTIPSSLLADLNPNPENVYNTIKSITVNSKGLTTKVDTWGSSNNTITSTTYKENAGTPFSVVTVTADVWTKVFLTDAIPPEDVSSVKAVILYVEPTGNLAAYRKSYTLVASPNQSDVYPIYQVIGGEDAGGGNDTYGIGVQCSVRIGGIGTNSIYIYLKNPITKSNSDNATYSFNVHLIAYQR
jgi:hypothetical protein